MGVKRVILISAFAFVSSIVGAQSLDTQLPADVSAFADQAVDFVVQALASAPRGRDSVAVEPFTTNGGVAPLGELLAVSISSRLANANPPGITVLSAPAAGMPSEVDYLLTGRVFAIESAVMVVLQLVDASSREILQGMESGFGMSPWVDALLSVPETATAAGGDRLEPDSRDNPYILSTGETVDDRDLAPEGDEDWYQYTATGIDGDGLFTVGTRGGADTYIEVFGPDDPTTLLAENDDSGDANAQVTVVAKPGQTFLIGVRGYDSSVTGSYSLFSRLEPFAGDPLEPNDTMDQAVMLDVNGDPVSTMLMPGSDEDWFYFDLSRPSGANTVVSIETTGTLDTYLELYNSDGQLLLENDDGGADGNARIDVFLDETGRYYVRVRHYDGTDQGDYSISVRLMQASPDQYEPDNTRADAREIPIDGTRQIRNFTPADELDWATFTLSATRTVEIRTTGDIDTYITLYDRLGNVIEEDDDSGGNYNARIERVLQRGTYYVEVRQVEGDSVFGGEYGLSVQAQ